MKGPRFLDVLARETSVPPAQAADELGRVVEEIVEQLRHGREAELPGLGRFRPGPAFKFDHTLSRTRRPARRGGKA